jgi:Na+-translocating ferredoxin:NAD+ oxidoreductase RnfC subunit
MPVSILTPEKVLRRTHKRQKHDQFGNIYRAIFAIKPHEILVLKNAYPSGEIDRMVYDLYELTEEEKAIVEGR